MAEFYSDPAPLRTWRPVSAWAIREGKQEKAPRGCAELFLILKFIAPDRACAAGKDAVTMYSAPMLQGRQRLL